MKKLTVEQARGALNYDAETGVMTWRRRADLASWWNTRYSGKPVTTVNAYGYLQVSLNKERVLAHRVAWLIHHGAWPFGEIDHVNGNKLDNRLENLRDVTSSENHKNMPKASNNTSGALGVSWRKDLGKWSAYIKAGGGKKHLGHFSCFDEAVTARREAENFYGYHFNHGRNNPIATTRS